MSLAELQEAITCKLSGKYLTDPIMIGVSDNPKLLVGESYDKETVLELLKKEPTDNMTFVENIQLKNFVKVFANGRERPTRNVGLTLSKQTLDQVKALIPRPSRVILFKPKINRILFRESVIEGDDLAFFMQLSPPSADLHGWKTIYPVNITDLVDRSIALGFRFSEGGREAYHAEKDFEMYR